MARKTKEGAEETRTAILEAALALFSTRGVARTSLSDVAQQAGVTRGAIYWHFANKDDLLHTLREETFQPYEKIAEAGEREDEPDPLGRLHKVLVAILTDLSENRRTRQLFQMGLDRGTLGNADRNEPGQEQQCRRQGLERFEGIMRNAIRKGQLSPHFDTRLGAIAFLSFLDGLAMNWLLVPDLCSSKRDVRQLADAFFFMLQSGDNPWFSGRRPRGKGPEGQRDREVTAKSHR